MPEAETHYEIETHHFNTVWLIRGICFVSSLVAGGFEWKLAACCSLVSPHRVSVRSQRFAVSQLWALEQRAGMLGQCRGQTQMPHQEIYGPLEDWVERDLVRGGKEKEHFPCWLCWLSRICGCSGLHKDALGDLYSTWSGRVTSWKKASCFSSLYCFSLLHGQCTGILLYTVGWYSNQQRPLLHYLNKSYHVPDRPDQKNF